MNRQTEAKTAPTQESRIRCLTSAGLMTALITLMTAYVCHIPVGVNGGYLHFGDAFIYLAAVLLPRPYALMAAALGGGLADLLTAPVWAPATILIKMLLVPLFSNKTRKIIVRRNVLAALPAYLISGLGYFVAEYLLFGSFSVFFVAMLQQLIQSAGSAAAFIALGLALDRTEAVRRFFS